VDRDTFLVDDDRRAYLDFLHQHCRRFDFNAVGYCLVRMILAAASRTQFVLKRSTEQHAPLIRRSRKTFLNSPMKSVVCLQQLPRGSATIMKCAQFGGFLGPVHS